MGGELPPPEGGRQAEGDGPTNEETGGGTRTPEPIIPPSNAKPLQIIELVAAFIVGGLGYALSDAGFRVWGQVFYFLGLQCGLYLIADLLKDKRFTRRLYWLSTALNVLLFSFLAWHIYSQEHPPIQNDSVKSPGWQPPQLPPACSNVVMIFGGRYMEVPVWVAKLASGTGGTEYLLKDVPSEFTNATPQASIIARLIHKKIYLRIGAMKTTIGGKMVDYPAIPYVKNNRLFVNVKIPFKAERHIVSMNDDLDTELPQGWDRNYANNEFEVVNEDTNPVLQVFYRRSNEVQVNGVFIVSGFDVLESFGGPAWLLSPVIRFAGNQITQDFAPEDFNQRFTNIVTMDTNAAYRMKFTDQKCIFKYPSWKFPGVLAD